MVRNMTIILLTHILMFLPGSSDEDSEDDERQQEEEDDLPPLPQGERNSQLTVGYKGDRSYVVRGNNIGVFNHDEDNKVKYYASISKIATPKGKEFKPREVSPMRLSTIASTDCIRLCFTTKTRKWS